MDKNGSAVVKIGMLTKTPKHFLVSSLAKSSLRKRGSNKLSFCACSLSKTICRDAPVICLCMRSNESRKRFNFHVAFRRRSLVFLVVFTLILLAVDSNLLVILFEGGQILASLGKLALFHSLADIPEKERQCHWLHRKCF